MSRRKIALAVLLSLTLAASTPLAAMPRDGRGSDPIERVVKFIKHLFHSITNDELELHPVPPHP
jgi:hypothetical protein